MNRKFYNLFVLFVMISSLFLTPFKVLAENIDLFTSNQTQTNKNVEDNHPITLREMKVGESNLTSLNYSTTMQEGKNEIQRASTTKKYITGNNSYSAKRLANLENFKKYIGEAVHRVLVDQEGNQYFCIDYNKEYPENTGAHFFEELGVLDLPSKNVTGEINWLLKNYFNEKQYISHLGKDEQYLVTQYAIWVIDGGPDFEYLDSSVSLLIKAARENPSYLSDHVPQNITLISDTQELIDDGENFTALIHLTTDAKEFSLDNIKLKTNVASANLRKTEEGSFQVNVPKTEQFTTLIITASTDAIIDTPLAIEYSSGNYRTQNVATYRAINQRLNLSAEIQFTIPEIPETPEEPAKPEIGTKASDKADGDQIVAVAPSVTIVDEVSYKNLVPGTSYTVNGKLMDKETGKALIVDGQEVTGSTTFTAEAAEGTINVEFTLDTSALAGKTLVVFESLLQDGQEIATHADLEDKGQTIIVETPEEPKKNEDTTPPKSNVVKRYLPQTGERETLVGFCSGLLILLGVGIYLYKKRFGYRV